MTKFTASKLSKILKEHKRWDCTVKKEGNRANLNGANLRKAELSDAYLRKAELSDADLSDANLIGARLSFANLSGAKLNNADLRGADLSFAALGEADLREANLQGVAGLGPEDISVVVTLHKAKLDPRLMEAVKNKYPHLLEDMNAKDSIEKHSFMPYH